uniref:Uncharacterized protein n=1 Tax=Anopheles dirus TaxID=7168 RepID=A0A182NYE0_9DIPT
RKFVAGGCVALREETANGTPKQISSISQPTVQVANSSVAPVETKALYRSTENSTIALQKQQQQHIPVSEKKKSKRKHDFLAKKISRNAVVALVRAYVVL